MSADENPILLRDAAKTASQNNDNFEKETEFREVILSMRKKIKIDAVHEEKDKYIKSIKCELACQSSHLY